MICFQSQECEKYHKPIHMFGQTHGCLTGLKQKVPFCWAAHDKITVGFGGSDHRAVRVQMGLSLLPWWSYLCRTRSELA
jgi:hypothetical protein